MVGSRVVRSRLVSGFLLRVLGLSLVFHISNISRVRIHSVGHDLGPAIRKGNTVSSAGGSSVTGLILLKVSLAVVISHTISEVVLWWLDRLLSLVRGGVVWGRVIRSGLIWSRGIIRSRGVSSSRSHKGSNGKGALKNISEY